MSHFKYHVFFCCNQRGEGETCCNDAGATAAQTYAKDRVAELQLKGAGKVRINKAMSAFSRIARLQSPMRVKVSRAFSQIASVTCTHARLPALHSSNHFREGSGYSRASMKADSGAFDMGYPLGVITGNDCSKRYQ